MSNGPKTNLDHGKEVVIDLKHIIQNELNMSNLEHNTNQNEDFSFDSDNILSREEEIEVKIQQKSFKYIYLYISNSWTYLAINSAVAISYLVLCSL